MRKISILFLITILAFTLNGCLLDRIKQRQYAKQMLKQQSVQTNTSKAVVVEKFQKRAIYTPSPSPLVTQKRVVYKKRVQKSSSRKKVVKTKKVKKYNKKIQKEPYSIGDDENDPELLGPQTTLDSNPLAKNSAKEENDKKKL